MLNDLTATTSDAEPAVQADEGGKYDLAKLGAKWKGELERSARYFAKWHKRCEKIEKIYLDQQGDADTNATSERRYAMLWANISVLQPAVYARTPIPAVERRFKDPDNVARTASEMLERSLQYLMDTTDIDSTLRAGRDDFLLCGRGTAWVRYEADFEPTDMDEVDEPAGEEGAEAPKSEVVTGERVPVEYVHWSDFIHSPARRWNDVTWVARAVPMDDDAIKKRFGKKALQTLQAEVIGQRGQDDTQRAQNEGKTRIWEIWCKTEDYCVWIADGSPAALDAGKPPLQFDGFFPCPRPAYATTSTGSLIPVPDYVYYMGQCEEIDSLTKRIAKLTDQLRLMGFYPAGDGDLSDAIEAVLAPNNDTILVPIPGWAAFSEKGGADAIVWLPIDAVQKVITACIEARKQLIDDVYQITGISDIVRGDTQASETATAQRIKSQWGSIRIRDRQSELARYARDIVRMAGEVVSSQFQPETLMAMTGMQLPTQAQQQQLQMMVQQQAAQAQQQAQQAQMQAQQSGQPVPQGGNAQPPELPQPVKDMLEAAPIESVMALIRNDGLRGFKIDIETDSTIEPDEDADKKRRMEFAGVVGSFVQQAGPVAQQMPSLIPVMGEVLLFVARGFRTGRQLETILEQAISETTQIVTAPKPPVQPSPDEVLKMQAEAAKAKATIQTSQIKAQAEQTKAQLSVQQAAIDHHAGMQQANRDATLAERQHAMDMEKMRQQQIMQAQQAQQPSGTQ